MFRPFWLLPFAYDFEGRLISATRSPTSISIVYDGDGNRVQKTVGSTVTKYLVDDRNPTGYAQVLEERDGSGNTLVSYVYGLDLISQKRNTGTVQSPVWTAHYFGYDGQGTVRYLTRDDGQISDTYTYDAFGILTSEEHLGTATENYYRYAGEQWDSHLGMYYLRARYYHPDTGRFWSMDTNEGSQTDPLSLHRYLYCHANPVNGVDPSGYEFTLITTLTAIAIEAWTAAKFVLSVYNGYSRASYILGLVQDLAFIVEAFANEDPEDDGIVVQMLQSYVKGAIIAAATGLVASVGVSAVLGVGGKALGHFAGKMTKAGIKKGGIQASQAWYKEHKRIWANRYKDVKLNGKTERVHYDENGWLKLDKFLHQAPNLKKNPVKISLQGSRNADFAEADKLAGIDKAYRDKYDLVWHHHQQLGKMMLVPRAVHNPGKGGPYHDGVLAIVRNVWGGYGD